MKCSICGADLSEGATRCPECGTAIESAELNTQTTQTDEQMPESEGQDVQNVDAEASVEAPSEAMTEAEPETAPEVTADVETEVTADIEPEATADIETEVVEEVETEAAAEAEPESTQEAAAEVKADAVMDAAVAEEPAGVCDSPVPAAPKKKINKLIPAVIIGVAAVCAVAFAAVKLTSKDPKQVVIDAFENVYPEGQVLPMEEIFGFKDYAKNSLTADLDLGLTLKMDDCSDSYVSNFNGSGLRFEGKADKTNKKTSINMGLIFNGMDMANLNAYYGEDTLMMSVPELSSKVLTLDLGDGLADRIEASPVLGSVLDEYGVDVEGFAQYLTEIEAEAENDQVPFDFDALMKRYKEGCKAKDEFKAAMTVTKGQKGSFTIDGAEASCKGYEVVVSKDSMINFLRSSSDFFLNDETLKGDFLKQLEMSVKMSQFMGSAVTGQSGLSAEDQQDQMYDEAKDGVEEMITYLDDTLTDVKMTVYVDKKGRLASVDGTTTLQIKDPDTDEVTNLDVAFKLNLEGGTYLTQNMNGSLTLTEQGTSDTVTLDLLKQGKYDGKELTCDVSADLTSSDGSSYNVTYTGTYQKEDGSYHLGLDASDAEDKLVSVSVTGAVDQLDKGKSFHMNMDAIEISASDLSMTFSGEYYALPLSGEVTSLEGETLDMLAATQDDWSAIAMEAYYNLMGLLGQ